MLSYGQKLLDSGRLQPLTKTGDVTINRLDLNRPALIAYRLRQIMLHEQNNLLAYYHNQIAMQSQIVAQLTLLVEKQQQLLEEQRRLLNLLIRRGSAE